MHTCENRLEELELLPVLSSRHVSYKTRGCVYSYVSGMQCFRYTAFTVQRQSHHQIRQICNVKPDDVATVRSKKLSAQLEIDYVVVNLREKKAFNCWFVHVERFSGAIKAVCDM